MAAPKGNQNALKKNKRDQSIRIMLFDSEKRAILRHSKNLEGGASQFIREIVFKKIKKGK
jgi:hypothetical protein